GIEYAADVADDPATDGVDETKVYENNDKLVVAVFVDGKLAGIFTKLAKYAAGEIVEGNTAANLATTNALITDNIEITLDAAVGSTGDAAEITVKAWLDGATLTQDYAAGLAAFSFNFTTGA
ncbi:MAG: hypothetical protein J6R44_03305, partial [Clostridia bacterium]|nr:hypothetical protein [Clostridia bacterium]